MSSMPPDVRARWQPSPAAAVLGLAVAVALGWAFWPTLLPLSDQWGNDPRYSHGYLVPLFSLYLLWTRRNTVAASPWAPSVWGVPVLAVGLGLRFAGTYLFFNWVMAAALMPCLAGVALIVGGRSALRSAWPAIAFLVFMIPLPYQVEIALGFPLQRIATLASTYALQTFGFSAFAEGTTIRMGTIHLGVVEACSGLSMLMIFFALSTAVAIVIRRPFYERAAIFLSAIPVALFANITRITVTGVLHKTVGSELADYVFHDLAGWLMMPFALACLWLELKVLSWIVVDRVTGPARLNTGRTPAAFSTALPMGAGGGRDRRGHR